MNWDDVSTELKKPLSPDAIKPPAPGKFGEYIDGLHAIREANRIFGHDGWSYSVTRLEMVCRDIFDGQKGPQLRVGYVATVRVEVDGVFREGVAVGSGVGKPESEADHHDSATKEAETDALKRALRSFGNTFGLALYEKDKSAREVGYSASGNEVSATIQSIETVADLPSLAGFWKDLAADQPVVARDSAVIAAKDKRKAELATKPDGHTPPPTPTIDDEIPEFEKESA